MSKVGVGSVGAATALAASRPVLAETILRQWRGLLRDLFDPYRPELHYMRGPGPAWHAKHAQRPAAFEPHGGEPVTAGAR